ncbi:hypothetical protein NDU88_001372 [Pleurodeles waltl]|uniref:Uncharacterized protein n=1 Tax=Pleurodeles waltl TaxID=8319 RepID=A0AAV7SA98_PLEWA|nr:hypothetical protein NDU88_001372 [Pleurodeles waltl]
MEDVEPRIKTVRQHTKTTPKFVSMPSIPEAHITKEEPQKKSNVEIEHHSCSSRALSPEHTCKEKANRGCPCTPITFVSEWYQQQISEPREPAAKGAHFHQLQGRCCRKGNEDLRSHPNPALKAPSMPEHITICAETFVYAETKTEADCEASVDACSQGY